MNNFSYDYRVIWDSGDNRWELQVDVGQNGSFTWEDQANSFSSAPNPPDLGTGTWTPIDNCGGNLIQFDGSGTQSGLLPVEWLNFGAKRVGNENVLLEWATASETDCQNYEIERMLEGGSQFTKIGETACSGTTIQTSYYSFIDHTGFEGVSYFRLKQLDFDGIYEYSEIRAVSSKIIKENDITFFPNPVHDRISGKLSVGGKEVRYRILREQGRELINGSVYVPANRLI